MLRCSVRSELGCPRVCTLLEAERTFPAAQERARLPLASQAGRTCSPSWLCRALLRALDQGRLQGSGTQLPWHCHSFAPCKCNPCCLLGTAGLAEQGSSLHLTSELQKSCSFKHCPAHRTLLSAGNHHVTQICKSWSKLQDKPVSHSMPQCHKSCLLGPAGSKSSAVTQLHSSTSLLQETRQRGVQRC